LPVGPLQSGYFDAKLLGKEQGKQYLEQYPQLTDMWDTKPSYEEETAKRIIDLSKMLRDDVHPFIRNRAEARTTTQEGILEAIQGPSESAYQLGWMDFSQEMSPNLQRLVEDYIVYDEDLPSTAFDQAEYVAEGFGISAYAMLELIRRDLRPDTIK